MLGNARARSVLAWADDGSILASTEGSSRIRFLASRTMFTSRSTSMVLNVGGRGKRSDSVGSIMPWVGRGRASEISCPVKSLSIMACSLSTRSVSTRSSSDIGAAPNLRAPLLALKACGFVKLILLPLDWGINDERRPVVSSHAWGETVVGFDDVTGLLVNTWDIQKVLEFENYRRSEDDC